jgi:septum formation protein
LLAVVLLFSGWQHVGAQVEQHDSIVASLDSAFVSMMDSINDQALDSAQVLSDGEGMLTADTIVVLDGKVMGKPQDEQEARRMLSELSGRTHHVITGVTLTTKERSVNFSVETSVSFRELTQEEISYYVEHYHPMDKAGSYGIQEWIGYVGVTAIEGSYFNVMGLPVQRIYEALQMFKE